jgi:hypothetical protein
MSLAPGDGPQRRTVALRCADVERQRVDQVGIGSGANQNMPARTDDAGDQAIAHEARIRHDQRSCRQRIEHLLQGVTLRRVALSDLPAPGQAGPQVEQRREVGLGRGSVTAAVAKMLLVGPCPRQIHPRAIGGEG